MQDTLNFLLLTQIKFENAMNVTEDTHAAWLS